MPASVVSFPVTVRLHGELTDEMLADLARDVEVALRSRLEAARSEWAAGQGVSIAPRRGEPVEERVDRGRLSPSGTRYSLPSFGPAEEGPLRADPVIDLNPPPTVPHPAPRPPEEDRVEPGPSPFDGQTIAILPESAA